MAESSSDDHDSVPDAVLLLGGRQQARYRRSDLVFLPGCRGR
jgi:hypothetical protein